MGMHVSEEYTEMRWTTPTAFASEKAAFFKLFEILQFPSELE